jgi:hypothetical protein
MNLPQLIEEGAPISRTIQIHPTFLLGVTVFLMALGAFFAETLFVVIAGMTGVSVLVGSLVWLVIGVVTMLAGIVASRMGGGE